LLRVSCCNCVINKNRLLSSSFSVVFQTSCCGMTYRTRLDQKRQYLLLLFMFLRKRFFGTVWIVCCMYMYRKSRCCVVQTVHFFPRKYEKRPTKAPVAKTKPPPTTKLRLSLCLEMNSLNDPSPPIISTCNLRVDMFAF
jgi:hypothetical protein